MYRWNLKQRRTVMHTNIAHGPSDVFIRPNSDTAHIDVHCASKHAFFYTMTSKAIRYRPPTPRIGHKSKSITKLKSR
ncbi:hypothetical protein HYPSUDRAFT_31600 [Hypholoma sublateritium FD-334 SS-4]|uniref:Uncharacterized protein n=1 Tax=Hypholoma sublateritium (strain FD-334 SS-4) TaxID=945553 RepID=A0A0D2PFX2_HYPSF|nr:hypothetical protein HYPSUDRAFT_31600 [Hypholoma sublateritium FD-334 SS-4]